MCPARVVPTILYPTNEDQSRGIYFYHTVTTYCHGRGLDHFSHFPFTKTSAEFKLGIQLPVKNRLTESFKNGDFKMEEYDLAAFNGSLETHWPFLNVSHLSVGGVPPHTIGLPLWSNSPLEPRSDLGKFGKF